MSQNSILALSSRGMDTGSSAIDAAAAQQRAVEQQNKQQQQARRGQQQGALVGAGVSLAMGNPVGAAIALVGLF